MALINLKTELTSLKFGNDRPGYGSSNLPYIQTQIPSAPGSPGLFRPVYIPGSTGNLDFPIRGSGLRTISIGQQTFTKFNEIDFDRIKKFLEDQPRGPLFLRKQVGLQLTNPKIETGNTLFGLGQDAPLPGILENTRVYDPTGKTTLAQVAAMGSGAHAVRSGLVAFAPGQKYYYNIVNQQNTNNITTSNRLVNLNALKMTTGISPFVNPENVFDLERVTNLGISLNRNLLFQYLGGPGSVYGAGTTTIKRVVDTTRLRSNRAMTYDRIKQQTREKQNFLISSGEGTLGVSLLNKTTYKINDFRAGLSGLGGSYAPWGNKKIDDRFFAAAGKYRDKMNLLYPFAFPNTTAPWEFNKEKTDDLIKFVFEAINNDDPSYSLAIFFRAFLTAGITDNHSAELNSFKYLGRGENFYTYQGFNRSVGFSFRIAAGSKDELIPLYTKLNTLVSQVYPDYSPKQNIMRAPIIRLTIGDYFYRVPGFLESVNITIDNGSPWEINLDEDSAQLPQVVDVSVAFKPILDVLPERSSFSVQKNTTQGKPTITVSGNSSALSAVDETTYLAAQDVTPIIANNSLPKEIVGSISTITSLSQTEAASRLLSPQSIARQVNPIQDPQALLNKKLQQQSKIRTTIADPLQPIRDSLQQKSTRERDTQLEASYTAAKYKTQYDANLED